VASVTTLIPISPLPSHPDPVVLEKTVLSIRERLPQTKIFLMFDAVTPEHESWRANYELFINRVLWLGEHEWGNCVPMIFQTPSHQTLMTEETLHLVDDDVILWSEQDTPLVNDIPFDDLVPVIQSGYANVIRFSHEALVIPEHQFLFLDEEPIDILGVPLLRTRQWSGRPHLASTSFYRNIARDWPGTPPPWGGPRFIEHIMYGHVSEAPFEAYRVHLYAPEEKYPNGTYVRSLHTDGRRYGAEEYDPSVSTS
jgi:hypothetical protein